MNANLMDILQGSLSEGMIDQLSQQLGGADKKQTAVAASGIMNTLMGALAKNASSYISLRQGNPASAANPVPSYQGCRGTRVGIHNLYATGIRPNPQARGCASGLNGPQK